MRAHRGQLVFGEGPGQPLQGASFLAERRIVLDEALLGHAPDLVNIFAHEVYHFVWRRLSNEERKSFADLLAGEKTPLHAGHSSRTRYEAWREKATERRWRDYVCEAFCDTAAGLTNPNTLISAQRRRWFGNLIKKKKLPV